MYEDGIDVVYELRTTDGWSRGMHTLPGWCAGDPQMGVTLYLLGHRSYVGDLRIVDWQPHDEDADDEPFPSDRELARRESQGGLRRTPGSFL